MAKLHFKAVNEKKREEKRREAERKKYDFVDLTKKARIRLSLLLDAMGREHPIKRKMIPDVYHADAMISFYRDVQYSFVCSQV